MKRTTVILQHNGYESEAYYHADGSLRWVSNDRPPFDDMLEANGIGMTTRRLTKEARDRDLRETVKLERAREAAMTDEERAERAYELRAAFGPGEKVINVFTGTVTIT